MNANTTSTTTPRTTTPRSTRPTVPPDLRPAASRSPLRRSVDVFTRGDTYRRLAYLLVGLPLGTIWFAVLVTCITVGVSLLVVALLGIPVLLATWYVARAMGNVERGAARVLLDVRLPAAPMSGPAHGNLWKRLRSMSGERDRWRELAYLLARFPAGVLTLIAAVTALAVPFIIAAVPISARIGDGHPSYGTWSGSDTLQAFAASSWSWLLVPLAAALLVGAVHLLVALADTCGRWTSASLGDGASHSDQSANLEASNI